MPTQTLAKLATTEAASATIDAGGTSPAQVMAVVGAMPPGFVEPVTRPMVYIGGETEGGAPFYTWNHDEEKKDFVPVNRFSARLLEIKTIIKNPDDELKRAVKVVLEFETATGGRVGISCGAKTWSALGIVAGISGMTAEQLQGEIGLSGKVGRRGVTFISCFAEGGLVRNPNAEELLKEARADDAQIECVEGLVGEIQAKLS